MDTVLKWHGGKAYLAKKIIALMPKRCAKPNAPEPTDDGWLHYVEPFAGGLSVLLANDPEGISEVVNDLHAWLAAFWSVLADEQQFAEFRRKAECTPFSSDAWDAAMTTVTEHPALPGIDPVSAAWAFFVACRQSMSGRMNCFTPLVRNRTRRGMQEHVSAWLSAVDGLPEFHTRLKRVAVLNDDALKVIKQQDGPRTLFYLDPPYLHETRATTGEYAHEMTKMQHVDLLACLSAISGRFLLSGYRSDLYDGYARAGGWNRHDFDLPNNAANGDAKRRMTECVWCNF